MLRPKTTAFVIVLLMTLWLVFQCWHQLKHRQSQRVPVVWKSSVGSEVTTGSEDGATISPPKTEKTERVENNATHVPLSIHLVVIPFMQYNNTDRAILAREKEYKTALQRNLNHPLVSHVHVLTTNTQQTLAHFGELSNQSKLVVSEVKSVDFMRDAFDYISQKLLGKDVMFSNADIYLGNGFDGVDSVLMSEQKIMYALTRRIAKEEKCDHPTRHLGGVDLCLEKEYWGSHDTFLFRVTEPLPEEILKELEFHFGSPGQENVLIWLFREKLKYCVINPCSVLEIFHLHCSDVRNREKKFRVNTAGKSGKARFTNDLVCL